MDDKVDGIFLIRIVASDDLGELLDHVVVLDAQKGHVLDQVERFALENRPSVLGACLGMGCDALEIAEIRKLELQLVGKGKKNRKKSRKQRSEGRKTKKDLMNHELSGRKSKRMRVVEDDSE